MSTSVLASALALSMILAHAGAMSCRRGEPAVGPGIRSFDLGDIDGPQRVGQTFRMGARGLHRLVIFPARRESRPDAALVCQLLDVDRDGRVIWTRHVPADAWSLPDPYAFEFEPLESAGRTYRLDCAAPGAAAGAGGALRARKGNPYPDGELTVNGRPRWGDLQFSTRATGASLLARLPGRARGRVRAGFALAGCAASLALGVLVVVLARGGLEP